MVATKADSSVGTMVSYSVAKMGVSMVATKADSMVASKADSMVGPMVLYSVAKMVV